MSKFKSFSGLNDLYSSIQEKDIKITEAVQAPEILPTNASRYLPESAQQDIDAKSKVELTKGTGPQAADNFEPVKAEKAKKKNEEKEEMEEKMEEEKMEKESESTKKVVKTMESVNKSTKYKKQQFTMSKSKFDQLYEDAVNNVPFVKEEEELAPITPMSHDAEDEMGSEEEHLSSHELIEMLEKVLAALKKQAGHEEDEEGHEEEEEEGHMMTSHEEEEGHHAAMGEAVDAEDLGHANVGSGVKTDMSKDGHKIHKVGALKAKGAAVEQGGPKGGDGTVNKAKDFDKGLQSVKGSREVGNLKVNKGTDNAFE